MSNVYMLVGIQGSGKSTYAEKLAKENNCVIFSSDALRKELYGSENNQEHNNELFEELHRRIIAAIKEDKNVVYDAMNLISKRRAYFLEQIKKYNCHKVAVIIATPYEDCLKRNAARQRSVPEYAIKKSYMSFTVPSKQEGFDEVRIIYPDNFSLIPYKDLLVDIPHDNPHHAYSTKLHMECAYNYLLDNYDLSNNPTDFEIVKYATLLHDIGKPFTKVFTNYKGDPTEFAHFYSHNNVGSYLVLLSDIPEDMKLDVSLLIQHHMDYYISWKQSEKSFQRDKEFLGERIINLLSILHDCDLNAH